MAGESTERVAVVFHEPELGGASLSLMRALPRLQRCGYEFTFWVPGSGEAEQELRRRGYEVATAERLLRFSFKSLREPPGPGRRIGALPAYLRSWRAWVRAQDATLIHANSLLALPEVSSRPRGGPPLVLHSHEVLGRGPKAAAAALLARRADAVIAVSEAAARALRRRGIRASVVYEAVPDPGPRERLRRDSGLVVGTLGTVSKRKGSDLFLAAAQRIQRQRNGIEFRMVGDLVVGGERPWAAQISDAAQRSSIQRSSGVDPFVELAEWDIFVLPSRMDPCPLAVLEAMAMGLPVVGTSVGGIPEQLGENAGLLVEPEDVDGLARAVTRLAESEELRRRLGAAARERAAEMFSVGRQADALAAVYRQVLAAAAGRARAPARTR
jgi:glycosyltransferase involved in cell wall biosynthesis